MAKPNCEKKPHTSNPNLIPIPGQEGLYRFRRGSNRPTLLTSEYVRFVQDIQDSFQGKLSGIFRRFPY